jgi:hypothetical protein
MFSHFSRRKTSRKLMKGEEVKEEKKKRIKDMYCDVHCTYRNRR